MILQAKNLRKSYAPKGRERIEILKGVSLSVRENEILCVVGASGSGKTTLLNILGTLDEADDGELWFKSEVVFANKKFQLKPDAIAKFRNQRIGFVFQFHHLLEDFTALENAAMPRFILTGDFKQAKEKAEELLVAVGLKDRLHHLPSELSGGEAQRVAVARALVNSPDVVLADEPSGNLDSKNSDKLYELISALSRERGATFVIVTHNARYAELASRTFEMKDGLLEQIR
ncbi:MAG: ABC transporter ATP-binding protein [Chloroherpetonaceae bacterium]|nr:ABC transporter ATP-binding protein [Chloroherpetonaceae bacterium]MDW8437799.1 ABC transporter ATP-binding protein [Chloroherpetonaceae bacterium]